MRERVGELLFVGRLLAMVLVLVVLKGEQGIVAYPIVGPQGNVQHSAYSHQGYGSLPIRLFLLDVLGRGRGTPDVELLQGLPVCLGVRLEAS